MKYSVRKKIFKTLIKPCSFTVLLSVFIIAVSCRNIASEIPEISYVKVDYNDLGTYLTNKASATALNYIEVTGTVPLSDFKGTASTPGALGQKIKNAAPKKIMLKLPEKVHNFTDMSSCFADCTNLVSVTEIPAGVTKMDKCFYGCTGLAVSPAIPENVLSMEYCFYNCTNLIRIPRISAKVENMAYCFYGCTELTKGPIIPHSVTKLSNCFEKCAKLKTAHLKCAYKSGDFNGVFTDCSDLKDGGIRVPQSLLETYKEKAGYMGTAAAKFAAE